ncbi:CAP domain-containing protein [Aggregicoccus sp. 17bor-14]|uniref:CAP domain-containing protein n=1 Tax=Myxococcaceae TaxID=31 RepID=UPI00129D1DA8|nr:MULTISPECIES: CAP domain-containing protein [Myxococcaceae]MBF5041007.1 CAP domain-containing protein [Simulacricoccus sp. 17bor-14]MRI86793.1 CAP domain-containing protein [Aggregicoccus sp. 17bor-14]
MLALTMVALLGAAEPGPRDIEQQAAAHVTSEYERVGRRAPALDAALSQAARALAQEALTEGSTGAADPYVLTDAVSDAGGADPTPRSYVVRAWVREHAIGTFRARKDLASEPATHVGVGAAVKGERAALVVLLAERKATLASFKRTLPRPGATQTLCGQLASPLRGAEVFVTRPDGNVDRPKLTRDAGADFCSRLSFPGAGNYAVEVIGRGQRGPEVAALFLVDVGGTRSREARLRVEEPRTLAEARVLLLGQINALRRAHQQPALHADPALEAVAQRYAERMAREGFFAHVAPDGSDLRQRMEAAGPGYRSYGENLGLAGGPVAAHFGIEHSPGHRKNLLGPQYSAAGIGVAFQTVEGRPQAIVVEVFAATAQQSADPLGDAYRAVNAHRADRHLPPLERSEVLQQIAFDHARRALKLDQPRVSLPGSELHERVFAAMKDVKSTSVDMYVTEDPSQLPESRSLTEPRNDRVGLATVRGDSPTYGKGRYWVVVIYAATH